MSTKAQWSKKRPFRKVCRRCGSAFYAGVWRAIYCSVKCRVASMRERARLNKLKREGKVDD